MDDPLLATQALDASVMEMQSINATPVIFREWRNRSLGIGVLHLHIRSAPDGLAFHCPRVLDRPSQCHSPDDACHGHATAKCAKHGGVDIARAGRCFEMCQGRYPRRPAAPILASTACCDARDSQLPNLSGQWCCAREHHRRSRSTAQSN